MRPCRSTETDGCGRIRSACLFRGSDVKNAVSCSALHREAAAGHAERRYSEGMHASPWKKAAAFTGCRGTAAQDMAEVIGGRVFVPAERADAVAGGLCPERPRPFCKGRRCRTFLRRGVACGTYRPGRGRQDGAEGMRGPFSERGPTAVEHGWRCLSVSPGNIAFRGYLQRCVSGTLRA